MRLLLSLSTLCASLVAAGHLAGQAPPFDVTKLLLGTDSMSITMVRSDTAIPAGTLWDELGLVPGPDATSALRRVYRTENRIFGPHLDTVVSTLPSLRLLYRRTSANIMSDSLRVVHDTVTGWEAGAQREKRPVRRYLPSGTIDGGSFDLLVRAFDWVPEATFSVQAFLPGQDSLATLVARFGGSETVTQHDGTAVQCWRIDGDFSGLEVTMWVDQRSRALVKEVIQLTPTIAMVMVR